MWMRRAQPTDAAATGSAGVAVAGRPFAGGEAGAAFTALPAGSSRAISAGARSTAAPAAPRLRPDGVVGRRQLAPAPVKTAVDTAMPSATPTSRSIEFVPLALAWSSGAIVASTAVADARTPGPCRCRPR